MIFARKTLNIYLDIKCFAIFEWLECQIEEKAELIHQMLMSERQLDDVSFEFHFLSDPDNCMCNENVSEVDWSSKREERNSVLHLHEAKHFFVESFRLVGVRVDSEEQSFLFKVYVCCFSLRQSLLFDHENGKPRNS